MSISMKMKAVVAALSATILLTLVLSTFATSHAAPRRHVVEIQNFKFVPASLTIRQGDTVEWINRDIVPHTATKAGKVWNSGKLKKGQSAEITYTSLGTETYLCLYHPKMHGEISVIVE